MMYRPTLGAKDRGGAIVAVLAIHAGLIFVLLHLSGQIDLPVPQEVLRTLDLTDTPPPVIPPPPPPPKQQERQRPKDTEGGSPANIRSEATEVVAPKPVIELPPQPQVAVTETPRQGAASTQGAADVRGPGTGAGGSGTGTGSGAGSGPGGGGGGIATRASLISPSLRSRDFPPEFRRLLAQGRSPLVIFTVEPNGRVSNCRTYQSSGDPTLDNVLCSLVTSRLVYRPAFNRLGQPVASQNAYRQAF